MVHILTLHFFKIHFNIVPPSNSPKLLSYKIFSSSELPTNRCRYKIPSVWCTVKITQLWASYGPSNWTSYWYKRQTFTDMRPVNLSPSHLVQDAIKGFEGKVPVLSFNWAPCHEVMLRGWRYSSMHSRPWQLKEVSGQLHAPATLTPGKESPPVPIG